MSGHTVRAQLTVEVDHIEGPEAAEDDVTLALAEEIGAISRLVIDPGPQGTGAIYAVNSVERD
jgi:hypothetical protein